MTQRIMFSTLRSGQKMPMLGFGTWQLQGNECTQSVLQALEQGYRHIDTAAAYTNHKAIRPALIDSGIPREELFITSKAWLDSMEPEALKNACHKALDELGVDYLNMYLIHWPSQKVPFEDTLKAMQELKDEGLIRGIGVSNFTIKHLQKALSSGVDIENNQVEFHPSLYQRDLLEFCKENQIVLTAYSPLARGQDLYLGVIQELSVKYGKSTAQIILRWLIQKDMVVIPKASSLGRIQENQDIFDWQISSSDMSRMDSLNTDNRVINPGFADF
jgi:2,5-diketo-D-gluconate reductase B